MLYIKDNFFKKSNLSPAIRVIICLFFSIPCYGKGVKKKQEQPLAAYLLKKIELHQDKRTLQLIFNDSENRTIILRKFASGDKKWLKIFPKLRVSSDGGLTLMLDNSIAQALDVNPESAIHAIAKFTDLAKNSQESLLQASDHGANWYALSVCGQTAEEWDDSGKAVNDLGKKALNELERRKAAVKRVKEINLQEIKDVCLKSIADSKILWKRKVKTSTDH